MLYNLKSVYNPTQKYDKWDQKESNTLWKIKICQDTDYRVDL